MLPGKPAQTSVLYLQDDDFHIKTPPWRSLFSNREYAYLLHVLHGMLALSEFDAVCIQWGSRGHERALHIYEPFIALNRIGYVSSSVVSLVFDRDGQVAFWTGYDNGIGVFSKDLTSSPPVSLPGDASPGTDFWHFANAIRDVAEDDLEGSDTDDQTPHEAWPEAMPFQQEGVDHAT